MDFFESFLFKKNLKKYLKQIYFKKVFAQKKE